MRTVSIRTEHLINPIGIDCAHPRISWKAEGGVTQTAYRIRFYDEDGQKSFDTQKVTSSSMSYPCQMQVQSRQRLSFDITLWDEHDEADVPSEKHFFEIGLLQESDFVAQWITGDYEVNEEVAEKQIHFPADYFQKSFFLEKPIKKARLYITACGCYEASLNGQRIGSDVLAPGYTNYTKSIFLQTYDVKKHLQAGTNAFHIVVADGWYRGAIGAYADAYVFGLQTKLYAQLEIDYADGTQETVITDESFAWSNDGPIAYTSLKHGEVVDARNVPSYTGKALITSHDVMPTAANTPAIKEHERFKPVLLQTPQGKQVLDFGQNLAGLVEFHLHVKEGTKVHLRMGEMLQDGNFTQGNFHSEDTPARQEILYTANGKDDSYKTTFSFFGFRYIAVSGLDDIHPENFTSIAIYSDLEETGSFRCSNELVNRMVENTRWSQKSNFVDVPTDCPTREKAGWTGDVQIFAKTASYFMYTPSFFQKWYQDAINEQDAQGQPSAVCPPVSRPGSMHQRIYDAIGGSVGWGDAMVILPVRIYEMYQDLAFLKNAYEPMKQYTLFMIRSTSQNTLASERFPDNPYPQYTYDSNYHLGEWLEPEGVAPEVIAPGVRIPREEEATAYLCYTTGLMMKVAGLLGKNEDYELYREYHEGAKQAYNALFVKNQTIDTDRQAKLVRPLRFGILDGQTRKNVEDRLVQAIECRNYTIGTGFLSTPSLLPVLTEAGHLDVAFRMLEQEECPGWLYQVKNGATTIWETWEGRDSQGIASSSQNHYSPGAVCEWLFTTVGGINVARENHFLITPHAGGTFTFADCTYDSIYGKVETHWKREKDGLHVIVKIPPNTSANVLLPDGREVEVLTGIHSYMCMSDSHVTSEDLP